MSHRSPKDFNRAMGAVIRKHRKTLGLKQSAAGDVIGVSYQQIQKGEHGVNAFSAFQLTKLAELFGVPVAQLYEEAGSATASSPPSEAENDSFLAARYVGRIPDPKLRSSVIDFTRKLAYSTPYLLPNYTSVELPPHSRNRSKRLFKKLMQRVRQYSVTLLPGNEVRFLSLSRRAKVKPEYRPMGAERYHSQTAAMFAVDHYRNTGRILLHSEVKVMLLKRKGVTKERSLAIAASGGTARDEVVKTNQRSIVPITHCPVSGVLSPTRQTIG